MQVIANNLALPLMCYWALSKSENYFFVVKV